MTGDKTIITKLAAFLLDTKRTRETALLARDIETALADHGVVVADITSAHDLGSAAQADINTLITKLTGATTIKTRLQTDASLLGGVKINLPDQEIDTTASRKLSILRANKF